MSDLPHSSLSESRPKMVLSGKKCPKLSTLTTLEIGGRPTYYAKVDQVDEAVEVARWAKSESVPLWLVGGGSNLLCDDDGLEGLVLQLALSQIEWGKPSANGAVQVTLGAGVEWHTFVEESVSRGLAGVECLIGIPGWAGAAPIQNIGAYGQSFSDTCESVYVYDLERDTLCWWTANECEFAYRNSLFKQRLGRYLILSLKLILHSGGQATLKYPQLINRLSVDDKSKNPPTLLAISELVKRLRVEKSMLWHPTDPNHRSAGSFFMNPILSSTQMNQLLEQCASKGLDNPPQWPTKEGGVKVPAAWLIERSGIDKGMIYKGVGVSSKHCLALINRGSGVYLEMVELAYLIQKSVWLNFAVWLNPEAHIMTSATRTSSIMKQPKVALATCSNLPSWEVDDHPLWTALKQRGIELVHPNWDDDQFDWSSCDLVIPRTTWDYQDRWSEFLTWMSHVDEVSLLLNPLQLMSWNLDKKYLGDLEITQPPIEWLEQGSLSEQELSVKVEEMIKQCGVNEWPKAFLKPTIGASAVGTLRFDLTDPTLRKKLTEHLRVWLPKRTMILQPYIQGVETIGECSLIYFSGRFSHGVRKVPVAGDYRVQDDYGASDMPWSPPTSWLDDCQALIENLPILPLYARCDFLHGPNGQPWLIELELIEPSLFFRHDPSSPDRLAEAIVERCREVMLKI